MVRMEEVEEEEERLRNYLQSFMGMEQSEQTLPVNSTCCTLLLFHIAHVVDILELIYNFVSEVKLRKSFSLFSFSFLPLHFPHFLTLNIHATLDGRALSLCSIIRSHSTSSSNFLSSSTRNAVKHSLICTSNSLFKTFYIFRCVSLSRQLIQVDSGE